MKRNTRTKYLAVLFVAALGSAPISARSQDKPANNLEIVHEKLKADKKGKLVFQCLNLSGPVADNPFERMGTWIKLSQIEVKAVKKGVIAKVTFSF